MELDRELKFLMCVEIKGGVVGGAEGGGAEAAATRHNSSLHIVVFSHGINIWMDWLNRKLYP